MYVMLDDDLPGNAESPQSDLAVTQRRIRELEEQLANLQEQLEWERQRNVELVNELKTATVHRRWSPRWRFWRRKE